MTRAGAKPAITYTYFYRDFYVFFSQLFWTWEASNGVTLPTTETIILFFIFSSVYLVFLEGEENQICCLIFAAWSDHSFYFFLFQTISQLFSDAMIEDIASQEHYENTVDEVRGERIMIVMFYANWLVFTFV